MKHSKELENTAYHEAGHALVHFVLGIVEVVYVTIKPEGGNLGEVKIMENNSNMKRLKSVDFYFDRSNDELAENYVITLLAGPVAERKYSNAASTLDGSDLETTLTILDQISGSSEGIERRIEALTARAEDMIEQNWGRIEALAAEFLKHETLPWKRVTAILNGEGGEK